MKKFFANVLTLAVFALVTVSFVTPASAQIMGAVLDGNWNPVPDAFVILSHMDNERQVRVQDGVAFTDEGGRFDLRRFDDELIADGEYLVEVQSFGYQIERIDVNVRFGYAYLEEIFLQGDMPGLGLEVYTFDFPEGTYLIWGVTRNGKFLSTKYTLDTIFQGPAETKSWTQFSRRSSGGFYNYVFIPRGAVPEGSTFYGTVTIQSSRSDLRVYAENNWFSFTPGKQNPYLKKSSDVPTLVIETLQEARAKVTGNK